MKNNYTTNKERQMIKNDMNKVVRGFILLLVLIFLYVITGWKLWVIVSAFPMALFMQVIIGILFLRRQKQKENQENDELDF